MACDDFLLPPALLAQKRRAARQSPWVRAITLLRCWRARARERRELAHMSSLGRHDLVWRDLGLSDADQKREVNKPFWRR